MKITFTCCLSFYLLLLASPATTGQILWDQTVSNPDYEILSRAFVAVPGGYLNVGQAGRDGTGTRPDRIGLNKWDLTGKVVWQKEQAFFGYRALYPIGVAVTAAGECYVGAQGFNPKPPVNNLSQGLLIKCSPQGDTLWTRRLTQQGVETAFAQVVTTADNGVVVIGRSGPDPFIAKYSPTGQLLWYRTYFYSSAFPGYLQQLAKRPGGFLVIQSPNNGQLPPKYLVLDEQGQLLAEKPAVQNYPHSLTPDAAGNVLAAGELLVKISPQGDTLWSRRYTSDGLPFTARAVAPLGAAGYLVAGTVYDFFTRYLVLLLVSPEGQIRRDTLLAGAGGRDVYPTGVVLDANRNYVIGGFASPSGGQPDGGTPGRRAVQFALALRNWERLLLTTTTSQLAATKGYTLYPNPITEGEQVRLLTPKGQPYWGNYEVLSGSTGQLLRRGQFTPVSGQAPVFDGMPPGLYWLRLATDGPTERPPMLRLQKL